METKFKIIETPDYILAVSFKKIIAYQPKNNAPELDLPLLPSFKKEIVGYKLKPNIDRLMVDGILKTSMPIWNDEDKSVYFIRGHVAGSLVAKMKELQVLDLWFTPIYEEVKSDWVKEHHLEYYYKEGLMSDEMVVEDGVEKLAKEYVNDNYPDYLDLKEKAAAIEDVIWGYKAATKIYSEDDLRKAIKMAWEADSIDGTVDLNIVLHYGDNSDLRTKWTEDEIIQSLKQPKTPKWFVTEMEGCDNCINHQGQHLSPDCCHNYKLKTTTINGKTYLVGTYE
jgi:hypothetical protein